MGIDATLPLCHCLKADGSVVTGLALNVLYSSIEPLDNGLSGEIKKRINAQKKLEIGAIACDEATCRKYIERLN